MKPSEAAEVSKSIYKTYGCTYPYDVVYYPEKLAALNKSGRIYSAVAVMGGERIAGHCALGKWKENPRIAELVAGVVDPEFRAHGCFSGLTGHLVAYARAENLLGIFSQAVTNHTYSQRAGHHADFHDCAILLGQIPTSAQFKGIRDTHSQKISMISAFRYLKQPPAKTLFPPLNHQHIIRRIYQSMGVALNIKGSPDSASIGAQPSSLFRIDSVDALNVARIFVECCGADAVNQIKTELQALRLKKIETVNLFLNLCDPLTFEFCAQFEALGFFFAGVLPDGLAHGDALILQYLNNVPLNYDALQLDSDIAREILAHIKKQDPNLR